LGWFDFEELPPAGPLISDVSVRYKPPPKPIPSATATVATPPKKAEKDDTMVASIERETPDGGPRSVAAAWNSLPAPEPVLLYRDGRVGDEARS
jgi:hypothetical protein